MGGGRDEPLQRWAPAEPDRPVLTVFGGRAITAGSLLTGITDPARALELPADVEPWVSAVAGDPESRATLRALTADVLGFTPGGTVLVTLPPRHPVTVNLVTGLLHSRRHVVVPHVATADAVQEALASTPITDVVGTPHALGALAEREVFRTTAGAPQRLVAVGSAVPDGRSRIAAGVGADVLVEYTRRDGVEDLVGPADSGIGGFWGWSSADPHRVAAVSERGEPILAGDLRRRAGCVAAALLEVAAPGEVVGAMLETDLDILVAYLAAVQAGLLLMAFGPTTSADDVTHLLDAGGARALVTDLAGPHVAAGGRRVLRWRDALACQPRHEAQPSSGAGGLLPYTSGTTGRPKVVRHPPSGWSPPMVGAWEAQVARRLGMEGPGLHLVAGRLHQPSSLYFASLALHAGQTLRLMDRWSPRGALDVLTTEPVTSAFMVPSMFTALLALPAGSRAARPRRLRAVIHATAACAVDVKNAMVDWWGPVLYDCYGPTEAPGTYVTPGEWSERPGTVGRPLPGAEVRIRDADGEDCPAGVCGRVFLRDTGFRYGDGAAPLARSADGFVSVGDLGYLDPEGWLYLVGRETDYINVGGTKFHPSEVEKVLSLLDVVEECAVTAVPERRLGQVAVAYVVPSGQGASDHAAVRRAVLRFARESLPIARVPTRVLVVHRLPRAANGELLRHELADLVTVPR